MKQDSSAVIVKRLVGFLHAVFACVALVGIGFMFLNSNYGRGLGWVSGETFEQSPGFYKRLQNDLTSVFDYITYREMFESNGEVDYNRNVLEVSTAEGDINNYTLNDIIQYGKSLGFYIDEENDYALAGSLNELPEWVSADQLEQVYVLYRCYQSEEDLTGPEQSFATLPELTYEILKRFSSYYSIYTRLMTDFTNFYFRVAFYSKNEAIYAIYSNASEMSDEDMMNMGKYIYYSGDSSDLTVQTNFDSTFPSIPSLMAQYNPYNSSRFDFIVGLDTTYRANDDYARDRNEYNASRISYVNGIYLMAAGLAGCLITLCFLVLLSGHTKFGDSEVTLYPIDRIKTDLMLVLAMLAVLACVNIFSPMITRLFRLLISEEYWDRVNTLVRFGIVYICVLIASFSIIRRYKAGTLWTNSLFCDLVELLSSGTFKLRLTVCFTGYLACNIFLIIFVAIFMFRAEGNILTSVPFDVTVIVLIMGNLLVFYYLYSNAKQTDKLREAIDRLASGDTGYKVDTSEFTSLEKDLAESINNIGDGLEAAIAEQVKSERLKADLITNVSHDIKTPLTSIINYVDLIRREDIDNPKIAGYLDVLDQKSQRLKVLTEDLLEASKASSGNINMDISDIDLVELVEQTNGEFEEKYTDAHLELVTTLPDEVIMIEADGRHLWRVLENLYNNACKYAMANTRVYVSVEDRQDEAAFQIKNISAAPLNISPDELTERFVRGDVSRATEGSGLGLSIARDLTTLQGGKFELTIDGDLFKAEVIFPIKN